MKKNQKKKPKPEKQAVAYSLTRKGMGMWFCLILFLCAWMFVLGVLVGRGTAPVHFDIRGLQAELAELRQTVLKQEEKRYSIDQDVKSESPSFDFYEVLKKKGAETESLNMTPAAPVPAPKSTIPAADKPRPEKISLKKQTFKKGKPVTPENTVTPKTVATPATQKPPAGGLAIQVASTKDSKQADRIVARLKAKGYAAYRVTASISGKGTWHRVRVAGFKTREAGTAILKKLKKEGFDGLLLKR